MGELKKMEIRAYSDPEFKKPISYEFSQDVPEGNIGAVGTPYYVAINPSKYSQAFKSEYNETAASGDIEASSKFVRSLPTNLELEFLFDRTGAIVKSAPNMSVTGENLGVSEDLETFKKIVFDYGGEAHKPNYLKLNWGTLDFSGYATALSIDFKLFAPNGQPLRAVAKVTFKKFTPEQLKAAIKENQSPDLTHIRVVKEGDTLPLMCKNIYGDSKYYLEVAQYNKLTKFRRLTPGSELYFPPIDKQA